MAFMRIFVCLVVLLLSGSAFAEEAKSKTLALVIGNSAYRHTKLASPVNDAKLMAEKLKGLGFEVFAFYDANQRKMKHALLDFADELRERGKDAKAIVFYAGHAVQMGGENYLIPVDEQIEDERDVFIDGLGLGSVVNVLTATEIQTAVVVVDACRNNPFAYAHGAGGLVKMDAPAGSLIAFSASPGAVAPDGPAGGNSPYTAALAKTIAEKGVKIEDVFKKVYGAAGVQAHPS